MTTITDIADFKNNIFADKETDKVIPTENLNSSSN